MGSDYQKILLNLIRQRILHYVQKRGRATAKEIGMALPDVPQASLYRHIKTLNDGGVLLVAGEKQIRGTLEHEYILNPILLGEETDEKADVSIQFVLLSLAQDFAAYFQNAGADPGRDKIKLSSSPLLMTDEEFDEYLEEVEALTSKYSHNLPTKERRRRQVTLVSSPT